MVIRWPSFISFLSSSVSDVAFLFRFSCSSDVVSRRGNLVSSGYSCWFRPCVAGLVELLRMVLFSSGPLDGFIAARWWLSRAGSLVGSKAMRACSCAVTSFWPLDFTTSVLDRQASWNGLTVGLRLTAVLLCRWNFSQPAMIFVLLWFLNPGLCPCFRFGPPTFVSMSGLCFGCWALMPFVFSFCWLDECIFSGDLEVIDTKMAVATVTKDRDEENRKEKAETRVTYNIVFVTAEAAPYSKTGGLGDVCGSLPIQLANHGHRIMVVSPRYLNGTSADENFARVFDANKRIKLQCFGGEQEIAFFHEYREGVDWVFVDHPSYHRPGNPYGDSHGAFGDNQFRFTLLCHAACEAPLVLPLGGYTYGEKCLFLVNDWHAGLVSVLLASKYRPHGVYKDARSILVIHNLAHQGVEPAASYKNLGLPSNWYGALEWVFPTWARTHALDTGEAVNILKGAIVTADRILTVSKGYAWEITTVEGGYGLNEILSSRRAVLNGITNGIHVSEWDPSSDKHIPFNYSTTSLSGKVQCKTALQQELGLPIKPECPLIGFIGRLDYQKGIDLIHWAIPELMGADVQFVMLGSGDPLYENWMRSAENTYTDKFRGWVGFNVPISHRITAGCDILLMPSRFEPCGLNQLYAMRYGTIPVVHATGGLRDTVENFNPYAGGGSGEGTGWTFSPLTKDSMLNALRTAIRTYKDHKSTWEGLMRRCMLKDFTWENAAIQYEQVFEWVFIDPPYVN